MLNSKIVPIDNNPTNKKSLKLGSPIKKRQALQFEDGKQS